MKSGQSYYSGGLLEEICEENRKKLAADPENISLRCNLGVSLLKLGRLEEAIKEFKACLAVHPTPEYWNNLGKAFLNAGQYEDAMKAFLEVTATCAWPDAFFNMGVACREKGDLEGADRYLQEASKINPRYREALNERAEVLELMNRKDEALHEYKKVIALFYSEYQFNEPENYKYDLSVLFDNPNLIEETIRQLRQFLAKFPGFADAHYKLGQALEAKGLREEALLSFRKALEINPHYETARKSFWKRK